MDCKRNTKSQMLLTDVHRRALLGSITQALETVQTRTNY